MKISRFKRCLRLPRNTVGRDLVVGDLHGHRSLFESELDRIGFRPGRDRVFSVGDLIDRGPDSLGTLALIEEPWFFAVLGNHELALLNKLEHLAARRPSGKLACAGSDWIHEALSKNRKVFRRLADRIASLPVALHVEGNISFNVTHGDLLPVGFTQDNLFSDKSVSVRQAEAIASSRCNVTAAMKSELVALQFSGRSVHVSPTPFGRSPMTYVGHTPTRHVTVHNSHVHIDQGVCEQGSKRSLATVPTVLDHREFASWLEGVATARTRTATASDRPFQAADISSESLVMA
jgi:serine/threonine protein phosphatase 1